MSRQRSSRALERATRRLAGIQTIDSALDLGGDLTVAEFDAKVAQMRAAVDTHNGRISMLNEDAVQLRLLEQQLSAYSARFLDGVSAKYGKDSTEYVKAGGTRMSDRKKPVRVPEPPPKP